jgi:hypothetical protein
MPQGLVHRRAVVTTDCAVSAHGLGGTLEMKGLAIVVNAADFQVPGLIRKQGSKPAFDLQKDGPVALTFAVFNGNSSWAC